MKFINKSDLLKELQEIKSGEAIYLNVNDETIQMIELLEAQTLSMNNLFTSYINNTIEIADQFNLEKFLNKLSEKMLLKDKLINNFILSFGEEVYNTLKFEFKNNIPKYKYIIDFTLKRMIIIANY